MSLISDGSTTWEAYSSHREFIKSQGQTYFGLLDSWWEPICDMPPVGNDFEIPIGAWDVGEFSASFHVPPMSEHPAVEDLVLNAISGQKRGARYIIAEPPEGGRGVYRIEYATAIGADTPHTIEVHGLSPVDFLIGELPYVHPGAWMNILLYLEENQKLWRRSLWEDVGFDDIPIYNSVSLSSELKTSDRLYEAIDRSCTFHQLLNPDTRTGSPRGYLLTVNGNGSNSEISVEAKFSSLLSVVEEPSVSEGHSLEIQLHLPGDSETVNNFQAPGEGARLVTIVRGGDQ